MNRYSVTVPKLALQPSHPSAVDHDSIEHGGNTKKESPSIKQFSARETKKGGEADAAAAVDAGQQQPPHPEAEAEPAVDFRLSAEELAQIKELPVERGKLKEIGRYVFFLVLFSIATLGRRDTQQAFYMQSQLSGYIVGEQFASSTVPKTYNDIGNVGDVSDFLQNIFYGKLWPDTAGWYNGDSITGLDTGNVLSYSRIIGAVRLRQVRAKRSSCDVPNAVSNDATSTHICWAALDTTGSNDDRTDFVGSQGVVYPYSSASILGGIDTVGVHNIYGAGGYVVDLPSDDPTTAQSNITALSTNRWLDYGTRAVFMDFSVFNPTLRLLCAARLLVEFPATGGAFPSYQFRVPILFRYQTTFDWFLAGCEFGVVLFVLYYLVQEVIEMKRTGAAYWKEMWNYVDVVNLLLFVVVFAMRWNLVTKLGNTTFNVPGSTYVELQSLSFWAYQESNVNAFNGFLMWLKLFKYLVIFPRMSLLGRTLKHAAWDLFTFIFLFFIVFLGFSQCFYLAMGKDVVSFKSLPSTMITLYLGALGAFDYDTLTGGNKVLGPLLFIVFTLLVFIVLTNMLIAIVGGSYEQVQEEVVEEAARQQVFEKVVAYFRNQYDELMKKLTLKRDRVVTLEKVLSEADGDKDNEISMEEMKELAAKYKDDPFIQAELAKFDVNKDNKLDAAEMKKLKEYLAAARIRIDEQIQQAEKEKQNEDKMAEKANATIATARSARGRSAREGFAAESEKGPMLSARSSGVPPLSARGGSRTHRLMAAQGSGEPLIRMLLERMDKLESMISSLEPISHFPPAPRSARRPAE